MPKRIVIGGKTYEEVETPDVEGMKEDAHEDPAVEKLANQFVDKYNMSKSDAVLTALGAMRSQGTLPDQYRAAVGAKAQIPPADVQIGPATVLPKQPAPNVQIGPAVAGPGSPQDEAAALQVDKMFRDDVYRRRTFENQPIGAQETLGINLAQSPSPPMAAAARALVNTAPRLPSQEEGVAVNYSPEVQAYIKHLQDQRVRYPALAALGLDK